MSEEQPRLGDSFVKGWPEGLAVPYNGPFRARVLEVHDGDTLLLSIALGFDQFAERSVRVYGINAPEVTTPEGVAARDFLRALLPAATGVRFTPQLTASGQYDYSFQRCVGSVEYLDGPGVVDLASVMVAHGFARWCNRDLKPLATPPAAISRWRPS